MDSMTEKKSILRIKKQLILELCGRRNPRTFREKKSQNIREKKSQKFSEKKSQKFSETKSQKFSEKNSQKFSEKNVVNQDKRIVD